MKNTTIINSIFIQAKRFPLHQASFYCSRHQGIHSVKLHDRSIVAVIMDLDLELKGGGREAAFLPSKFSSLFTQNKGWGGEAGPPGSSPRSATAF